jgi:hypothetical protein
MVELSQQGLEVVVVEANPQTSGSSRNLRLPTLTLALDWNNLERVGQPTVQPLEGPSGNHTRHPSQSARNVCVGLHETYIRPMYNTIPMLQNMIDSVSSWRVVGETFPIVSKLQRPL